MTPNVNDLRTIKDEIGNKRKCNYLHEKVNNTNRGCCICKDKEKCYEEYYNTVQSTIVNKSIPRLRDIDMWEVSENLFLK